ncbi:MAG: hypothetical protein QE285_03030 [Aquabacterium sp.]|nr:hypothetical protein [Aquabacterium sp.]
MPPLADTVDALDQLGEREDVGGLKWLASVGFNQAATELPAFGARATRPSSQRSPSSWRIPVLPGMWCRRAGRS